MLRPLSTKMAREADKEASLNEQNPHSKLRARVFLEEQCLLPRKPREPSELIAAAPGAPKAGERRGAIRDFTSARVRVYCTKNSSIKSAVSRTKQNEKPPHSWLPEVCSSRASSIGIYLDTLFQPDHHQIVVCSTLNH